MATTQTKTASQTKTGSKTKTAAARRTRRTGRRDPLAVTLLKKDHRRGRSLVRRVRATREGRREAGAFQQDRVGPARSTRRSRRRSSIPRNAETSKTTCWTIAVSVREDSRTEGLHRRRKGFRLEISARPIRFPRALNSETRWAWPDFQASGERTEKKAEAQATPFCLNQASIRFQPSSACVLATGRPVVGVETRAGRPDRR